MNPCTWFHALGQNIMAVRVGGKEVLHFMVNKKQGEKITIN
jgi:hypothetical protein